MKFLAHYLEPTERPLTLPGQHCQDGRALRFLTGPVPSDSFLPAAFVVEVTRR